MPPDLDMLVAVALATLDRTGLLIDANSGFLRLVNMEKPNSSYKGRIRVAELNLGQWPLNKLKRTINLGDRKDCFVNE